MNADSSNTALQEPHIAVMKRNLPSWSKTCDCLARKLRHIDVTGQISAIDKNKVKNVLGMVWMSENQGTCLFLIYTGNTNAVIEEVQELII